MSMDVQRMKDELLLRGIDPSKPAFVYPSAGRRPEELNVSRGVNAPLQAARGWAAGLLGLPGDVEGLLRQGVNFAFGPGGVNVSPTPALPTSDFYREYLPGYDPQPFARAVSGAGALTGGMGATGVARGAMKAGQAAGQALGPKAAQMAESYLQSTGLAPAVVKPKGGNWMARSVENAVTPLVPEVGVRGEPPSTLLAELTEKYPEAKLSQLTPGTQGYVRQTIEELKPDLAIEEWVNKKLKRYIQNELATPEDPLRKLAERGVTHFPEGTLERATQWMSEELGPMRKAAGFPEEGLASTPTGKGWEQIADESFRILPAKERGLESLYDNPWLKKVDPNTPTYQVSRDLGAELYFDHLVDELRNATRADSDLPAHLRWKPEDLSKVTMEQAVQRVNDINKYRSAKKAEANEALASNPATFSFKDYETVPGTQQSNKRGLSWKQIKSPEEGLPIDDGFGNVSAPGYVELENALKYEGDIMGHCVGGYCDDVFEGRKQIYSLRDKNGEPHVTIEVKPKDWIETWESLPFEKANAVLKAAGRGADDEQLINTFMQLFPQDAWRYGDEIVQIRGKGNSAPKPEYIPFIQDFIRSKDWGEISEFKNAGFDRRATGPGGAFDLGDIQRLNNAGIEVPKYLTKEEVKTLRDKLYQIDTGKKPKTGYAKGGRVPTMDQMRLALMDKKSMKDGGVVDDDYRGEHRAPGPTSGKPMHDLKDVYPDDFYGPNGFRYYADTGAEYDRPSYVTARMAKGKPDQKVWIHRAIPTDVYKKALSTQAPLQQMIRPGDWVTLSKQYAREHGEARLKGDYKIASKQVPASHLYTNGDSINEWGYHPTSRMDKE